MLAENLPGVFLEIEIVDDNWQEPSLLYIGAKCREIWGYSDQELLANSKLFFGMHDANDTSVFASLILKCIKTKMPIFHRFKITTRDGQTRWLDYRGGACAENGRVRIQGIALDATREVKVHTQMEEERLILNRAQKIESIGQLTGGVAHDFNNLLAVILGNLELLRDDEEPAMRKTLIDAAIVASLRGADLTKSMLAFARKAPLTPVVLDLNSVVRDAKRWIGRTLPDSIVIKTALSAKLWPVEVDPASMESALLNLALNARDAMNEHGTLTIETSNVQFNHDYKASWHDDMLSGRYVMLAISDTGSGIDQAHINEIFEPFFTTKPAGVGSGLGLSMTLGFMKQSGGTVQVHTEIGEGTTFKLFFPVSLNEQLPNEEVLIADQNANGNGRKLLVVEDEDAVRDTLVTVLERAGYHVTSAVSGDAALKIHQADPTFDLLLTDIVMPGQLQGTCLAKAVRKQNPILPVIFMSGYASKGNEYEKAIRPEDNLLMKPVQRADILSAIEHAMKQSSQSAMSPSVETELDLIE